MAAAADAKCPAGRFPKRLHAACTGAHASASDRCPMCDAPQRGDRRHAATCDCRCHEVWKLFQGERVLAAIRSGEAT